MKTNSDQRAASCGLFVATLACLSACVSGCGAPGPSEAVGKAQSAVTAGTLSAFLWSYDPSENYTANTEFQSEPNIAVTHVAVGHYIVAFPSEGPQPSNSPGGNVGGNVQVTTYGGGNQRCKVEDWWSNGTTAEAAVACYAPNGIPQDSLFTANFHEANSAPSGAASGGYVWAFAPVVGSYNASSVRSWSSTGLPITIARNGPGSYAVTLQGQGGVSGGTVEVTAYGMDSNYCEVGGWYPSGYDQIVNIECFATTGQAADSMFSMTFSQDSPNDASSYTYAWSGYWQSGTFTAPTGYQAGSIMLSCGTEGTPSAVTITNQGIGTYDVTFPGMKFTSDTSDFFGQSNVHVSAYGWSGEYCSVSGWWGDASSATARVVCFDGSGNPADSMYTITYSSSLFIIC